MLQNLKKILTPVDFSDFSIDAAKSAYELCKETGGELHLIHVVAPHHMFLLMPISAVPGERAREMARESAMVEQAEDELERIKKDQFDGSKKVRSTVVVGHPVNEIERYARKEGIDLILLPTHGRTGIEHVLIGSVAEKLVRTAPCSVMVIRARPKSGQEARS